MNVKKLVEGFKLDPTAAADGLRQGLAQALRSHPGG